MPFDGTHFQADGTVRLLTDAHGKIAGHGWVTGSFGDSTNGYCIMGALIASWHEANMTRPLRHVLMMKPLFDLCRAVGVMTRVVDGSIPYWNDHKARDKNEVLWKFDEGISRRLEKVLA